MSSEFADIFEADIFEAEIEANRKPLPPISRAVVEQLKADWRKDPIWDLEDAAGFEEYREELLAYRLECESEWKAAREEYRQRVPERYRGTYFSAVDDEDIAEWANKQAADGYAVRFIVPAHRTVYEDTLGPCVYVLAEREEFR